MNIGDSVRIKEGIISPDYDNLIIGGWEGRIMDVDNDMITIELDSITLSELREDYIINSMEEVVEWSLICLEINEVDVVKPRDSQNDVLLKQNEINMRYLDEEEKRIFEILGNTDNSVNKNTLQKYYKYLKKNFKLPCILTGMEDFDWEEPYVIGGWDEKEYEKLKLTHASYTDKFEFIKFINKINERKGIEIKVKRLSDKKKFNLPLWDLEVVDNNSPNFLLVSDYSSWMTNYPE